MTPPGLINHRDRERALGSLPALDQGEYLAVEDGPDVVLIALNGTVLSIGRAIGADLTLDDATVSRRHVRIIRDARGTRIVDDRSLNGTFVNDERVDSAPLRDGDVITLGRARLVYVRRA
jgi:pSer/pThr/pTyr-binding forkhead associated (FHA) protein